MYIPVYSDETAVTITLASLDADASLAAGREGAEIDNSTDLYQDIIMGGKVKTGAGITAGLGELWVGGSIDGADYPSGLAGSDADITITNKLDLYRGAIISLSTAATTYIFNPFSVARLFGGVLPPYVTVFFVHSTVIALDSTEAEHEIVYRGINTDST